VATRPETRCRNCGAALGDRYCHQCGQDSRELPTRAVPLVGRLFANATGIESRAPRSLLGLLFRPGHLTWAYLEGRRVRYSSPVQLYLWCTAAFFLLHAYSPFVQINPETGTISSDLSAVSIEKNLSADTLERLAGQGINLETFASRFDAAVSGYLPLLLIGLVVASAGLLALQFRREPFLAHAIFALHWCAFYFVVEGLRQILPFPATWQTPSSVLTTVLAMIYLWFAMRKVYRRGWFGICLRAILTVVLFSALLGGWLHSTTFIAERLA